jgi:hypothetical protein
VFSVRYRTEAEGSVQHLARNTELAQHGSNPMNEINAWFAASIKKRPTKEVVEQRVNIMAVRHMAGTWLVTQYSAIY